MYIPLAQPMHVFRPAQQRPLNKRNVNDIELIKEWQAKQDPKLLQTIMMSHEKLVQKVANGYRGYGLPLSDLISEGNIGMMHALQHFEPQRGFRFSTYAVWWIKSLMHEFIIASHSLIRIPKSPNMRKLFFKLPSAINNELSKHVTETLSDDMILNIAHTLKVTPAEVIHMQSRLKREVSLNSPLSTDNDKGGEWQDFIPDADMTQDHYAIMKDEHERRTASVGRAMSILNGREKEIIHARHFKEPPESFETIGQREHLSRERIRQIEKAAFNKMRSYIKLNTPLHFDYF